MFRRNKQFAGVLKYLQNPNFRFDENETGFFSMPSDYGIFQCIKKWLTRMYPATADQSLTVESSSASTSNVVKKTTSKLEEQIKKYKSTTYHTTCGEFSALKNELKVFETTGKRTENLENLHKALSSLPPISVEAERAFSTAGLFVVKLRNRLSDISLDRLTFLKKYFARNYNITIE